MEARAPAPHRGSWCEACGVAESRPRRAVALSATCRGQRAAPRVDSELARHDLRARRARRGRPPRCQAPASRPTAPTQRHRAPATGKHQAGSITPRGSPGASSLRPAASWTATSAMRRQQPDSAQIPCPHSEASTAMTHPYKPTIFALNTHKLDVLPDPKDRARSIEVGRRGHLASLVRDRAAHVGEHLHSRGRRSGGLNRRTMSGRCQP